MNALPPITIKRKVVFQDPLVRFHVNWSEGKFKTETTPPGCVLPGLCRRASKTPARRPAAQCPRSWWTTWRRRRATGPSPGLGFPLDQPKSGHPRQKTPHLDPKGIHQAWIMLVLCIPACLASRIRMVGFKKRNWRGSGCARCLENLSLRSKVVPARNGCAPLAARTHTHTCCRTNGEHVLSWSSAKISTD